MSRCGPPAVWPSGGTGDASETGIGPALGTKLNIPLPPGADDRAFETVDVILAPTTPTPAWDLLFNRSGDNYITNSTIKYAALMMHVGDMRITGNRFLMFGGITLSPSQAHVNTSPVITDNLFELAYPSNGGGRIDLRGKSPLFSGNTVKSVLVEGPSTPAGSNLSTIGVLIGPYGENMGYPDDPIYPWGPRTGGSSSRRTVSTGRRVAGS